MAPSLLSPLNLASASILAEELGVTTDYLLSGKAGIVTDTIPAIKAAKGLNLKAKKVLISMVEELREPGEKAEP